MALRCSAGAMAIASAGRNARSIAAAIPGTLPPAKLVRRPASQIAASAASGPPDRRPAAPARRGGQKKAREHRDAVAEQHLVAVPQGGRQGGRQRHGARIVSEPSGTASAANSAASRKNGRKP